jgi:hypothetical protein
MLGCCCDITVIGYDVNGVEIDVAGLKRRRILSIGNHRGRHYVRDSIAYFRRGCNGENGVRPGRGV